MTSSTVGSEPRLVERLRADLDRSGFTVDAVNYRLGPVASAALHREQRVPAELATRGTTDPLGTLIRLFTLGEGVTTAALDSALPSLGGAGAAELGLVAPTGSSATALVDLRPYGEETHQWWVASDLSELATGRPLALDHVLGIGGASTTLASWTVRRPVRRALDLGTGCGVQALHLSGHADRIVATDISERALRFAALNFALAGQDVDLRRGSMLEPVEGERFDLVVSNPPFVVTPRARGVPRYEYRDGGGLGDEIVAGLVRGIAEHLNPGGIAQFLGNWELRRGERWSDRVEAWLAGTGLDAWVVQREQQDPAEYAELWARDGGARAGSPAFDGLYEAWLADFAARDVETIGFGVLTLARPVVDRPPFRDLIDHRGPVAAPMGPSIDAGLVARAWLADHDDEAVLDRAWVCAEDLTEERHGRFGDPDPVAIIARQGGGLGRTVRADTALAAYLSVCDGELTARVALTAIAALLDRPTDEVIISSVPTIRSLVADGLLA